MYQHKLQCRGLTFVYPGTTVETESASPGLFLQVKHGSRQHPLCSHLLALLSRRHITLYTACLLRTNYRNLRNPPLLRPRWGPLASTSWLEDRFLRSYPNGCNRHKQWGLKQLHFGAIQTGLPVQTCFLFAHLGGFMDVDLKQQYALIKLMRVNACAIWPSLFN